jgi:hypothetical protein
MDNHILFGRRTGCLSKIFTSLCRLIWNRLVGKLKAFMIQLTVKTGHLHYGNGDEDIGLVTTRKLGNMMQYDSLINWDYKAMLYFSFFYFTESTMWFMTQKGD